MSTVDLADDALLEECMDELDAAIERLDRFPVSVLALALRAHLSSLLCAMAEGDVLTRSQLKGFLAGLQTEVLESKAEPP